MWCLRVLATRAWSWLIFLFLLLPSAGPLHAARPCLVVLAQPVEVPVECFGVGDFFDDGPVGAGDGRQAAHPQVDADPRSGVGRFVVALGAQKPRPAATRTTVCRGATQWPTGSWPGPKAMSRSRRRAFSHSRTSPIRGSRTWRRPASFACSPQLKRSRSRPLFLNRGNPTLRPAISPRWDLDQRSYASQASRTPAVERPGVYLRPPLQRRCRRRRTLRVWRRSTPFSS